ncbi:hypothetical protein EG829_18510, partial [bacterium]|nr:hypothetical protein [bacterium]
TAGALLINGTPTTNVQMFAPDVYLFSFPQPPTGQVQVAWSQPVLITDASANSNRFAGGTYLYNLAPGSFSSAVRISEFMADNARFLDNFGQYSDWIEIYNSGDTSADIGGWYLTDAPDRLTRWRFPAGTVLPPRSYRLVWASGVSRTNLAAPLHADFKLDKAEGGFLGLVHSDGETIVSSFANYPRQTENVSYGSDRMSPSFVGYFLSPTPGGANATAGANFASEPRFSRVSGTFQQPFDLQLEAGPGEVVRYFLVTNALSAALTNVPDGASPTYSGPIRISESVQVRARAFPMDTNRLPGPPASATYLQITSGAANFKSHLPLVLFHNFGGGTPPASADQSAVMMVFGTALGQASLNNPPDLVSRIGINIRGRSTQGMPKSSYAVETWDEFNLDTDVELLGMPSESDWVFYAPNVFDKVLIHNPLIHALSRKIGRYSSRARMAEVFTSFGSGPINYSSPSSGNYNGVYVIEEKIKGSASRVDIPSLGPGDTNATSITGGYVLKIDSRDADERGLSAAGASMVFVEPDMKDYAAFPGRAAQENYIRNYF